MVEGTSWMLAIISNTYLRQNVAKITNKHRVTRKISDDEEDDIPACQYKLFYHGAT